MGRKKSTPEAEPTMTPDPFDPELDADPDDLTDDVPDDPDLPDDGDGLPEGHASAQRPPNRGRAFEGDE